MSNELTPVTGQEAALPPAYDYKRKNKKDMGKRRIEMLCGRALIPCE